MSVLSNRALPSGFIEPCIPTAARVPPSGPGWLHEIKHDGYRLICRLEGRRVRLFTRRGMSGPADFLASVRPWRV
jgi:bifunctional non-homologous end joining protein LigD